MQVLCKGVSTYVGAMEECINMRGIVQPLLTGVGSEKKKKKCDSIMWDEFTREAEDILYNFSIFLV